MHIPGCVLRFDGDKELRKASIDNMQARRYLFWFWQPRRRRYKKSVCRRNVSLSGKHSTLTFSYTRLIEIRSISVFHKTTVLKCSLSRSTKQKLCYLHNAHIMYCLKSKCCWLELKSILLVKIELIQCKWGRTVQWSPSTQYPPLRS